MKTRICENITAIRNLSLVTAFTLASAVGSATNLVQLPSCLKMITGMQTEMFIDYQIGDKYSDGSYKFEIKDGKFLASIVYRSAFFPQTELLFSSPVNNAKGIFFDQQSGRYIVTGQAIEVFERYQAFGQVSFDKMSVVSNSSSNLVVANNSKIEQRFPTPHVTPFTKRTGATLYKLEGENLIPLGQIGVFSKPRSTVQQKDPIFGENFKSGTFSPDQKTLVLRTTDSEFAVYDLESPQKVQINGKPSLVFTEVYKSGYNMSEAAFFSADGRKLIMVSQSGAIKVLTKQDRQWKPSHHSLVLSSSARAMIRSNSVEAVRFGKTNYGTDTVEIQFKKDKDFQIFEVR